MSNVAPRSALKKLATMIVVPSLCVLSYVALAAQAKAVEIYYDSYGAVAYSPSTGAFGYAWDCGSRGMAEQVALSNCPASDARIVGWVQDGWLVLAIGENNSYGVGWEYGDGAYNGDAAQTAIDECLSHGDHVRVIVCLFSGDLDPVIYR